MPPDPRGALALECQAERRFARVHVSRDLERYNVKWKLMTGLLFLGEALFSAALLATASGSRGLEVAQDVAGGYLGLDALATAVLIFHPVQVLHREYDTEGTWQAEGQGCPASTALAMPGGWLDVPSDGSLRAAGPEVLRAALTAPGTSFSLTVEGVAGQLRPSERERCEWAGRAGVDTSGRGCGWVDGPARGVATLTLPTDAPVR